MSLFVDAMTDEVAVWSTSDLLDFVAVIGGMYAEIEPYIADDANGVGWSALWDVDRAPSAALPWLAQVVGERVPTGSTDVDARSLITAVPNQKRGTTLAIVNAVKQTLTGTKQVLVREGFTRTGVVQNDTVAMLTLNAETPSANAVAAAVRRTAPADIFVDIGQAVAPSWAAVEAGGSWATLESTYGPTWGNVASAIVGYTQY